MATKEKIFEFDATQSIDNLRNLRAEIKELKDDLEQLEIGSEAYREVSAKLAEQQYRLNEVMGAQKDAVKALKPTIEDAEGSFNALNKELASLKEQWKATGDEIERARLTEKINGVKGKINEMNESIGNYQHNVGNYTNSIVDAFGKMGISVEALNAPLKQIGVDIGGIGSAIKTTNSLLKAFSGQNLAALKSGFQSVTSAIKGTSGAMDGLKSAIVATGIGALIVLIGTLVTAFDRMSWASKDSAAALSQVEASAASLDAELKASEAMMNYRIEIMKLEGATEEEVLQAEEKELIRLRDLAVAKEAEIWKNMRLIESEEDLVIARQKHQQALAQITKLNDQLDKNAINQALAPYRAAKKARDKDEADRKSAAASAASAAKQAAEQRKREQEQAEKETLQAAEAALDAEMKLLDAALKIQSDATEGLKSEKQKEIDAYNTAKKALEEWGLSTEDLTEAHNRKMKEFRQQDAEDAKAKALEKLEFEEEMRQKQLEIQEAQTGTQRVKEGKDEDLSDWDYDTIVERNNAEFDAAKTLNDSKIALNQELMLSYEETSEEYQRLLRENDELAADTELARAKRDKANADAYDKLMKKRAEATKSMVTSTSNLLKQASQAMGENSKAAKGFAVASATIDTIAAALAGFRAGYNQWKDAPGPLAALAPIQGAINAAAALAAGYAQVKQIMSVDPSGSNAGGAASSATALAMPNIEGLNAPMDYTRQVTTDTEKEELNRDNRVYILESDIQDSGRRVRVREEETTF